MGHRKNRKRERKQDQTQRDKWRRQPQVTEEYFLEPEPLSLVEMAGFRLQKFDESARAAQTAEALLKRLGDEPARAARFHCARALDRWADGAHQVALDAIDHCVALSQESEPRDDVSLARAMHLRAFLLEALHRNADAMAT